MVSGGRKGAEREREREREREGEREREVYGREEHKINTGLHYFMKVTVTTTYDDMHTCEYMHRKSPKHTSTYEQL